MLTLGSEDVAVFASVAQDTCFVPLPIIQHLKLVLHFASKLTLALWQGSVWAMSDLEEEAT